MNPTTILIVTGIATILLIPIAILVGYTSSKMFLSRPVAEKNFVTIANILLAVASACLVTALVQTAILQYAPYTITIARWFIAVGCAFLWFSILMMAELRISIIVTGRILKELKSRIEQLQKEAEEHKGLISK